MSMEWYDMIAKRNGGYRSNAKYTVEGVSGETIFERKLSKMLEKYEEVLDAGCGHGEFTLKMRRHANRIIGIDNSFEMIKIANKLKTDMKAQRVEFLHYSTKEPLPFKDQQFDLIYSRRGPTSIISQNRILKSGGLIFGIHSSNMDELEDKLINQGFTEIEFDVYDSAFLVFPDKDEFGKYLSASHGNPDYTAPENRLKFEEIIAMHTVGDKIKYKEWRYIWKAKRR